MAYCLRQMGVIRPMGKQGNAIVYEAVQEPVEPRKTSISP
jgi:hypothetical protein